MKLHWMSPFSGRSSVCSLRVQRSQQENTENFCSLTLISRESSTFKDGSYNAKRSERVMLGGSCPKSLQNDSWWFPWNKIATNSMIFDTNCRSYPGARATCWTAGVEWCLQTDREAQRSGGPELVCVRLPSLFGLFKKRQTEVGDVSRCVLLLMLLLSLRTSTVIIWINLFVIFFSSEWWFPENRRSHQGWWKISDFLPNTRRAFEKIRVVVGGLILTPWNMGRHTKKGIVEIATLIV